MSDKSKNPAPRRRREILETAPATRAQVGSIVGEFSRHFGIRLRDERLAVSAALLDLDDLGSTKDLTMGQAGKLVRMLREMHDRVELDHRLAEPRHERVNSQDDRHRGADRLDVLLAVQLAALTASTCSWPSRTPR